MIHASPSDEEPTITFGVSASFKHYGLVAIRVIRQFGGRTNVVYISHAEGRSVKQESYSEVILFEGTLPRAILWSHFLMWHSRCCCHRILRDVITNTL